MKIEVSLLTTSQPIVHLDTTNSYTKDGLYCIYIKDSNTVFKYPTTNIF